MRRTPSTQIQPSRPCQEIAALLPRGRTIRLALLVLLLMASANALQLGPGRDLPPWWNFPAPPTRHPPSDPVTEQYLHRGNDYLAGRGVPKDPVQAAYWYKKAADLGNPDAQAEMGYLCFHGIGVPRNTAEAANWFLRGAGGGSPLAKRNLAVLYVVGIGVTRDPKLAADLFTQLAEKGDAVAEAYLGILFLHGIGVAQDDAAAEKWFASSAKKRCPEGEYAMGRLFSLAPQHQHNFAKAASLLRRAARAGLVPAISALGILLVHHPEVRQSSPNEGLTLLTRAAEAGSWESSATLGHLARDESAGSQNAAEAFRWLTIAARQGGTKAEAQTRDALASCRKILTSAQQDQQLRQAESWLALHPDQGLYAPESEFGLPVANSSSSELPE